VANSRNVISGLGGKLIQGTTWMLAMRWASRLMGLASMVVVARLLTPADFGIFAVATVFIALLDAFTDIGTDLAIIRHRDPKRQHYDTAWTFKIILHAVSALLIVLSIPLAVSIYNDTRYEAILLVLAFSMLLGGFGNIGVANFRRDLNFNKDFQYNVLVQLVGVLSTLVLAIIFQNYWALVLGVVVRSIAGIALSYLMQSYRPRFSIVARQEMFSFSLWTMVRSMAMFLAGSADRLIIGVFYTPSLTGLYAISSSLANMAVFELLLPIGRALLPGLAAMQGDREWEARNLKKIFGATAIIAAAVGFGVSALAEPAVILIYGEQYTDAGSMLSVLAITAAVSGLNQPASQYLTVIGKVRELAIIIALEGVVAMVVTFLLATNGADIQTIINVRLMVAALALLRLFYMLRTVSVICWRDIAESWLRPVVAGLLMYGAMWALQEYLTLSPLMALTLGIPLGAFVYIGVVMAMWCAMKRPDGLESLLLEKIKVVFDKK
jgi:O-antigen/teichoic acid export membrane protein